MVLKKIGIFIAFMIWTLACIYGTYWNTVENAELTTMTDGGYEITYHNTGDVFSYN